MIRIFGGIPGAIGTAWPADNIGKSPRLDTNLPETNGGSCDKGRSGWVRAMKQAVPYLGRYLSKFVFEIIPGALVSVLAAYFLSMLHLARGAEPTADPVAARTTVAERRAFGRRAP